ncbi:MAG TPA: Gfo/Idh/MocA family oxidoreductase [Limnochordia bacterium]
MIKVGIAGRRGASFMSALRTIPDVEVVAYCDIDPDTLERMAERYRIPRRYTDFAAMVDSDLDAVIVATPMPLHVPQSVAALRAGKHVLCEVPAAVSLEECWELLEAVAQSGRRYMMAENYCYLRSNVLVRELVRRGFFGEVYFGIGEYVHELKALNEQTPWRRVWQTGRNGNTYPTHSLGPVLQWMDDRVVSVVCLGSGHHYRDPRGVPYENEDTTITLCQLAGGGLVQLRLDMLSNRPHNMTYYSLQGTKGCYEAARGMGDQAKVWLADFCPDPQGWRPLAEFEEYLPERWRNPPPEAVAAGHGGGDYWEIRDFIDAIREDRTPPIDVVTAVEWTAVGLCSIQSIGAGGAPVSVPDFRKGAGRA